jgi:hypothetical protein
MIQTKSLDLFAGIPVADYAEALKWYEQLIGSPPAFFPNGTEAVWSLRSIGTCTSCSRRRTRGTPELRYSSVISMHSSSRSLTGDLTPQHVKLNPNGVRKITYRDADGNEIGFGGGPN